MVEVVNLVHYSVLGHAIQMGEVEWRIPDTR